MRKITVLVTLVLALAASAMAQKRLLNVDKNGLGLQGYDPVAYFTVNQPLKGSPAFQSQYNGATYHFFSATNKAAFDANPAKYEPQFGGFCAYAVSQGHTAKIEPDAFQIQDGRLLVQYDKSVREKFNKDSQGNLKKADQNWPGLVEKNGK